MFHTIKNIGRVMVGRPTKERPSKARLVDIFADPGGDWTANKLLNEEAKERGERNDS